MIMEGNVALDNARGGVGASGIEGHNGYRARVGENRDPSVLAQRGVPYTARLKWNVDVIRVGRGRRL